MSKFYIMCHYCYNKPMVCLFISDDLLSSDASSPVPILPTLTTHCILGVEAVGPVLTRGTLHLKSVYPVVIFSKVTLIN